jgi:hypothetical protein
MAAFSAAFEGDVDFSLAAFEGRGAFAESRFAGRVRFAANEAREMFPPDAIVPFARAHFAVPEHAVFHSVALRPHWFVNVDARRLEFTNVEWRGTLAGEIEGARALHVPAPHRLIEQACNRLAVNAEENQRYAEASRFRYWAMEAGRRSHARGFACWRLDWWYWAASGYGERVARALLVLAALWLGCAALYTQVAFVPRAESPPAAAAAAPPGRLAWGEALIYSVGVMTLQKPSPAPASVRGQALVAAQTIAGPIQAALLALAMRRKFMR